MFGEGFVEESMGARLFDQVVLYVCLLRSGWEVYGAVDYRTETFTLRKSEEAYLRKWLRS